MTTPQPAKIFLQIDFNSTDDEPTHNYDRLLLWPLDNCFKVRFHERKFIYEMTFQTLKDVANYCHTFFEIIATDVQLKDRGDLDSDWAVSLFVPGFDER